MTTETALPPPLGQPPLLHVVAEIERHLAEAGWDQPPALFALVETADLLAREPQLAATLGLRASQAPPGGLTPVQQDDLDDGPIDEVLAQIAWPPEVLGCVLVQEVLVLPPEVEQEAPAEGDLAQWAATHEARREMRLAAGVLRDGSRACALRMRAPDRPGSGDGEDLLVGEDLAPHLSDALLATLED